jgi:hypothetical protein
MVQTVRIRSGGGPVVLCDGLGVGCCQNKIYGLLRFRCGLENQPFVGFQRFKLSRGRHNAEEVRQGTVLQQLPAFFLRIICSAD